MNPLDQGAFLQTMVETFQAFAVGAAAVGGVIFLWIAGKALLAKLIGGSDQAPEERNL